ncbi:serine/threonine protein phosphatase [Leptobacterium flavescens]|uniref:Serine/threonine protein phosphatase n=1 Tax=Leptobacterium flavescens TaxID=472055 RepID=A0A6P0UUY6_9FLAO|nr:metallophosphoesterase family protein [Leptobacterium flavescens]NER14633.1 serine/threonine protein phosphatase [Leptobacterium flavescens]
MSSHKRLSRAFENAKIVEFDDSSKFILFSDCHRGDNSFADDFANNRNMYFHALTHYYNQGFTYCELGDGDELWENRTFEVILHSHKNVFMLMKQFYEEERLHLIFGNHDMVYRNQAYVEQHLYSYFDPKTGEKEPLFDGISFNEAIILKHKVSGQKLFLTHGHQADFMNYHGWRFNRFLVRVLWKPLQVVGIADPTSPAKNYKELRKVERRTKNWISKNNNQLTITGHTHRPRFPKPGDRAFFNDGSCVHPRSITGIEIENGGISLIKWNMQTTKEGFLQVVRTVLEGPQKLSDYMT